MVLYGQSHLASMENLPNYSYGHHPLVPAGAILPAVQETGEDGVEVEVEVEAEAEAGVGVGVVSCRVVARGEGRPPPHPATRAQTRRSEWNCHDSRNRDGRYVVVRLYDINGCERWWE